MDDRSKAKKNAILIFQLPPDLQREALDKFPKEQFYKVTYTNGEGLKIYFKDYKFVRWSIRRRKIEVAGTPYGIYYLVTNLAVCGIGNLASPSRIEEWMENYAPVIDYYPVDAQERSVAPGGNSVETTVKTDDLRIILDVPEVLADFDLTEIHLWSPELGDLFFRVTFFCRLCRQNGHKQYQCPKYFPSEDYRRHSSEWRRNSWEGEECSKSPSDSTGVPVIGDDALKIKKEVSSFHGGGQFIESELKPDLGAERCSADNASSTSSHYGSLDLQDEHPGFSKSHMMSDQDSFQNRRLPDERRISIQNNDANAYKVNEMSFPSTQHISSQATAYVSSYSPSVPSHASANYETMNFQAEHSRPSNTETVFEEAPSEKQDLSDQMLTYDYRCMQRNNNAHEPSESTTFGKQMSRQVAGGTEWYNADGISSTSSQTTGPNYGSMDFRNEYSSPSDTQRIIEEASSQKHQELSGDMRTGMHLCMQNNDTNECKVNKRTTFVKRQTPRKVVETVGYASYDNPSTSSYAYANYETDYYQDDESSRNPPILEQTTGMTESTSEAPTYSRYRALLQEEHPWPSNARGVSEEAPFQGQTSAYEMPASMDRYDLINRQAEYLGSINDAHEENKGSADETQCGKSSSPSSEPVGNVRNKTKPKTYHKAQGSKTPRPKKIANNSKDFGEVLSKLLPPNSDLDQTRGFITRLTNCEPKDVPGSVQNELKRLLRWNYGRKKLGKKAEEFLKWLGSYLSKMTAEKCRAGTCLNSKSKSIRGSSTISAGKPKATKRGQIRQSRAFRGGLSKEIEKAVSKTKGVLSSPRLCNFLNHVRGRRKVIEIAGYFGLTTDDVSALALQLEQVEKAYFVHCKKRGKKEERDISFIKNLRMRLLRRNVGSPSDLPGTSSSR